MLETQLDSNPYTLIEKPHKHSKWAVVIFLPAITFILITTSYAALTNPETPIWVFPFILFMTLPWFFLLPTIAFRHYTLEVDEKTKLVTTTYKLLLITKTRQYKFSDIDLLSVKAKYVSSSSSVDYSGLPNSKRLFALTIRTLNGKNKLLPIVLKTYDFANTTAKTFAKAIGCRVETWAPRMTYPKSKRDI